MYICICVNVFFWATYVHMMSAGACQPEDADPVAACARKGFFMVFRRFFISLYMLCVLR